MPKDPQDAWGSASKELFQAARSDHSASSADRERVRRALAQRIAATPSVPSSTIAAGKAGSTLASLLKIGFGISLAVVATVAVRRLDHAEPSRANPPLAAPVDPPVASAEPALVVPQPEAAANHEQTSQNVGQLRTRVRPATVDEAGDEAAQSKRLRPSKASARSAAPEMNDDEAAQSTRLRAGGGSARSATGETNDDEVAQSARLRAGKATARSSSSTSAANDDPSALFDKTARTPNGDSAAQGTVAQNFASDARAAAPNPARVAPAAATNPTAQADLARESSAAATSRSTQPTNLREPVVADDDDDTSDERAAARRAPISQPTAAKPSVDPRAADARAELKFVRNIQAALERSDSANVLTLTAQHQERWPHGTFVQEREGLRAVALCNTAAKEAATQAKMFLAQYPRTPLGPRVREACKQQLTAAKPSPRTQQP